MEALLPSRLEVIRLAQISAAARRQRPPHRIPHLGQIPAERFDLRRWGGFFPGDDHDGEEEDVAPGGEDGVVNCRGTWWIAHIEHDKKCAGVEDSADGGKAGGTGGGICHDGAREEAAGLSTVPSPRFLRETGRPGGGEVVVFRYGEGLYGHTKGLPFR